MKFLPVLLIFVFFGACNQQKKQADYKDEPPQMAGGVACRRFYDSMVALADTAVEEDDDYSAYYILKEITNEEHHLTYPAVTFATGDKNWDKKLDKVIRKKIDSLKEFWIEEFSLKDDTSEDMKSAWERMDYTIKATPVFVSKNWVSIEFGGDGYYGGAHRLWQFYYLHFYKDSNGNLMPVEQRDIFIYDADSSVKRRYYHSILKGMDNAVNTDTVYFPESCNFHARLSFEQYTVPMHLFLKYDPANEYEETGVYQYYLIPTKTGLKTKTQGSDIADFASYNYNIIIPYQHFKGIIKEEYLKAWTEN